MVTISDKSMPEDFQEVLQLEHGDLFKWEYPLDYETVMNRVQHHAALGQVFETHPVPPGHSLYTLHGPNCCAVTKNVQA